MEIHTKISEEKYPKVSVTNIEVLQEPFCKRKWCLRDFADTQEGCEIISQQHAIFVGLRSWLEVPSFPLTVYIGQLQEGIHNTVQKGCEIIPQQKGDFAALCKMLPSARSDWLAMAATSSFQLRIAHRLKNWIVDFLSFEMVYSMHHLDFRKCPKSGCYDCHQE